LFFNCGNRKVQNRSDTVVWIDGYPVVVRIARPMIRRGTMVVRMTVRFGRCSMVMVVPGGPMRVTGPMIDVVDERERMEAEKPR
jgi:hypothetical protein